MIKFLRNKQACEQFNSWLGGFGSILKHMVPGNFDWFLHTFYHTRYVLEKQDRKRTNEGNNNNGESGDDVDDAELDN